MALVIPFNAGAALSSLGWQVVYRLLSMDDKYVVERFYLPTTENVPKSEETGKSLKDFPVVAVSLVCEEDAIRFVRMLLLAGIEPEAARRENYPIILAGGPLVSLNPAPLVPALDAFFVGEAEAGFLDTIAKWEKLFWSGAEKKAWLEEAAKNPCMYVPAVSLAPVSRAVLGDKGILPQPASSLFVSNRAEFKDMFLVELNRGCPYSCQFCAATRIYSPYRRAGFQIVKKMIEEARPRKVGLVGTALGDWPGFSELLEWLTQRNISFGLSSLRADALDESILLAMRKSGVRTLTVSLEGFSEHLRKQMCKYLNVEKVIRTITLAAKLGFNHLKIYLIFGWPGESQADIEEFVCFLKEVCLSIGARKNAVLGGKKGGGFQHVTISANPLVPKPWTPVERIGFPSEKEIKSKIKNLQKLIKPFRGVSLSTDGAHSSFVQAFLARGGEELFSFVRMAAQKNSTKEVLREIFSPFDSLPPILPESDLPWEKYILPEAIKRP